jgi:hypothetical protein
VSSATTWTWRGAKAGRTQPPCRSCPQPNAASAAVSPRVRTLFGRSATGESEIDRGWASGYPSVVGLWWPTVARFAPRTCRARAASSPSTSRPLRRSEVACCYPKSGYRHVVLSVTAAPCGVNCHSWGPTGAQRVDDRPVGLNDSAQSKSSRLQAALPHEVENGFSRRDKIVGDDAAVASPPHCLRTHYRAAPFASLIAQMVEADVKRM